MSFKKFVLLFFCLIQIAEISAQEIKNPDFFIVHYTDENGLPQNSIKAIVKDRWNFLWLGTEDGLVRFDGQKFFTFNKSVIPILSNRVSGFIPFISSYTIKNKEFAAVGERGEVMKIVAGGHVEIDSSVFKFNTPDMPFIKGFKGKTDIIQSFPYRYPFPAGRNPLLIPAGNNRYYVWSLDKVEFFIKDKKQSSVTGDFKEVFLIDSRPYATLQNGKFVNLEYGRASGNIRLAGDITRDMLFSNINSDYKLFWNNISQNTYLYFNKRFYSLKRSNKSSVLQTRIILKDFDFDEFNISTAYYDEEPGYLFLGSYTNGVFVLRHKNFQTKRVDLKGRDNVFYAQKPVSGNGVLSSQGFLFDKTAKGRHLPDLSRFAGEDFRYYVAMNRDSSFWMGNSVLLTKMDNLGKKKLLIHKIPEKFKALYTDPHDTLWIGGTRDVLFSLNTLDQKSVPTVLFRGPFGDISCMVRLPGPFLLLGTSKGLFKLNILSKQLETVKGIEQANIRSLYYSKGETWITTYGDGLYHLKESKITKLPLDKNQFLATSHCIVEDKKGFFWITTNKGLFQVSKADLLRFLDKKQQFVYYLYYDKRHGFATNEFNGGCQPCALVLADHTISLPSMNGFVWFNPEKIKAELPDQNIYIDRIELENHLLKEKSEIEIPGDFGQLKISVISPYFNNRNNLKIEYSFQKEGDKSVWMPVSNDFDIQIPNTSSGKHELLIRKFNGFGKDNFSGKTLKIYIRPAWYETRVFMILVALCSILLFWIILRLRTTYLLKRERKKNLYKQYHISRQIVAAINHDIQTPLHYISNSFSQIQNRLKKNNSSDSFITKMSEETINTINYARSHTSNLLNYIKSQNNSSRDNLKIDVVDVYEIIEHSSQILSGTANYREIQIINNVTKTFLVKSDAQLLSVIIQNLLDNAVKLSASTITISAISGNDFQQIIIEDTANGIPDDILKWMNHSYKSYDNWLRNYDYPNHKGLGLVIVKDLTILLDIRLSAEKIESGSIIKLLFGNNVKQ
ncbi:two-component regulator propeller domain-containing protein [Dyadobacter sp. CY356]|uniref:ligand-binding sensor domain-containing protein n=1 Tax=Dyadobacter sp. CY356 TaxID=2906442 RepID=UPI001F47841D|nr:HAMP domain-containing sensor histidine kinase [Dyadobacter sp. CY356]MCF0054887.1 ATP-binding protein [Dyadobacter sp. CY356]